ncbi:MAG: dienelactone hydrolase family protein [Alphaproteobacteria bacterium]|nr:dienelactone hydrolase family protein [Alphaproteobacteria bacterium]
MCDSTTEHENDAYLSRRGFAAMTAAAALAAMLPSGAFAADLAEQDVTVETPDGKCDAYFVHPAGKAAPAVVIWPDILGLRPALRAMGKRLAAEGYAVLVVNPYYRSAKAPVVPEGASFRDPAIREKVMPMKQALTSDSTRTDIRAFVAFLDANEAVDKARGIGVQGYCMGGPLTFWSVSEVPARIRAIATFHGGGLVTDAADSPHLGIPKMKASALIAVAANDDEREPETKGKLREAFDAAKLTAEIEVYAGTMHGWCPPDSAVYDEGQAEKAWARLLALYGKALA